MNALEVANKFRQRRYTSADMQAVENALKRGDALFLSDVVASYIKYADRIDESALVQYLKIARDFWPVHEIISGLSILKCKDSEFANEIVRYAKGVEWDGENYARIAAIAAIPRILKNDSRTRDILRAAARSENIVVRDVALEAAQEILGTPPENVKRGLSEEDLVRNVPGEVRSWLGLEH